MTLRALINMLESAGISDDIQVYYECCDGIAPVTGMLYDKDGITLTDEDTD